MKTPIADIVTRDTIVYPEAIVTQENSVEKSQQNVQELPEVLFHSSPRVVRLTLEAQGVLLYNSQKQ